MGALHLRNFFLAELPNGRHFPSENYPTSLGVQAGCFITWGGGRSSSSKMNSWRGFVPIKGAYNSHLLPVFLCLQLYSSGRCSRHPWAGPCSYSNVPEPPSSLLQAVSEWKAVGTVVGEPLLRGRLPSRRVQLGVALVSCRSPALPERQRRPAASAALLHLSFEKAGTGICRLCAQRRAVSFPKDSVSCRSDSSSVGVREVWKPWK